MNREDLFKFTNSIIFLAQILNRVEDKFLKQKLYDKISDFVSCFVEYEGEVISKSPANDSKNLKKAGNIVQHRIMSHNVAYQKLINSINNLVDYLEYLAHISKTHATPLLMSHMAQRNLLKFKFHLLKQSKNEKTVGDVSEKENFIPEIIDAPAVKVKAKIKSSDRLIKPNSNKEMIFNFVKKFPDVRTKEIIDEFSALSGRTVKRNLKELTEEGLLKKKSDGAAVHYLVSE